MQICPISGSDKDHFTQITNLNKLFDGSTKPLRWFSFYTVNNTYVAWTRTEGSGEQAAEVVGVAADGADDVVEVV